MNPEEMSLGDAIQELRSIAHSLEIDLPMNPSYGKRLETVATFLEQFGDVLQDGLGGLTKQLGIGG